MSQFSCKRAGDGIRCRHSHLPRQQIDMRIDVQPPAQPMDFSAPGQPGQRLVNRRTVPHLFEIGCRKWKRSSVVLHFCKYYVGNML
jgi:hypothetical protein